MKTKSTNYLFKPILLLLVLLFNLTSQAQNEYVKRINHPSVNALSLQHSSFIKGNNFYTVSHYNNDTATEESTDFQKTDLVGNIQSRLPFITDFNFQIKPLAATLYPSVFISSYIQGPGTINYFIGYINTNIIVGEIDNFGVLSNVKTIQSSVASSRIVMNKMILNDDYLYAVGSYTDDFNNHSVEVAVFKFDLSFNVAASYTISTLTGSTQFDDEITEGLDLIIDQNDSICVVGNLFEYPPVAGGGVISTIFGSPLAPNHNYGFLCKIHKTNNTLGTFKIYGETATPTLESLSFRRIAQVNSEYVIFGHIEYPSTNYKPLILKLDVNTFTITAVNGFGTISSLQETITDFVYDASNNHFYVTSKGFNNVSPSPLHGFYYNPNFMRNVSNQKLSSLYKINANTLSVISRRKLNVSSANPKLSLESICLATDANPVNDRLIITGMNNDLGDYNKIIWYINLSSIDDISSVSCSKKYTFDEFEPEIDFIDFGLFITPINTSSSAHTYDDFQLVDNNDCYVPLTNISAMIKSNNNSNNQIESITLSNLDKFLTTEQNTVSYKFVKIYSMSGQLIYSKSTLEKSFLYSINNGVYLVQLMDNNDQIKNIKLLINN